MTATHWTWLSTVALLLVVFVLRGMGLIDETATGTVAGVILGGAGGFTARGAGSKPEPE